MPIEKHGKTNLIGDAQLKKNICSLQHGTMFQYKNIFHHKSKYLLQYLDDP